MPWNMKIAPTMLSVMTPFPHRIELDAGLDEARAMMRKHDIHHLPVADGDELVGIVADRNIERALAWELGSGGSTTFRVRDVYSREVFTVDINERLDGVLAAMARGHIDSALVVKHGRLAGIFTETDAFRCFAELLAQRFPPGHGDDAA